MPDVFEVLRADHGDVQVLLAALENSQGHSAGASLPVLAARKEAAQRLVIDTARHEVAEEDYFWPAVRTHLGHGNNLADEAIGQEQEAKEAMARLDKLEADDDEFDQLLAELIPAVRRHLEFEETRIWPEMRKALSPAVARELGDKLHEASEYGPTRPHPHTPPRPGVLKTVGPAVAVADRLRDAATGRGKTA